MKTTQWNKLIKRVSGQVEARKAPPQRFNDHTREVTTPPEKEASEDTKALFQEMKVREF